MRMFLGIALDPSATEALIRLAANLRRPGDNLRWQPPESLHVTLVFLGSVTPTQHACLIDHLATLIAPPATIELDGIGAFERPGILYAYVTPTPSLLHLQRAVTAVTQQCGFTPELRPYRPHITLARGKRSIPSFAPQSLHTSFTAAEFLLYESRPTPTGSQYLISKRFALHS